MILQPGDIAIDYSYARPTPLAIVAAGVKLVVRYISPRRGHPKNISAAERDALLAAGLGLLLVWEGAATDALQGAQLGTPHGAKAEQFAHDLGNPADIPVIAAVDTNPIQLVGGKYVSRIPEIVDYLGAFNAACGYPMGVYGNDLVVDAATVAGLSVLNWQCYAWSKHRISPNAHCFQELGFVHPPVAALGSVDDNTVLRPFAVWATATTPPPDPPPPPPPVVQEDDMPHFVLDETGDIWLDEIDWQGHEYTDTVGNLGIDWRLWDLPGLPVRQRALLEEKKAIQSRPTPPPQVVVPLGDHFHVPGGVAQ